MTHIHFVLEAISRRAKDYRTAHVWTGGLWHIVGAGQKFNFN